MFENLNKSKQYVLSYHITQTNNVFKPSLRFNYEDGTFSTIRNNGNTDIDFNIVSEKNKIIKSIGFVWSTQNGSDIVEFSNIMLREVNTDDTFVEHEEQTVTFPFEEGQVLCEGDYLVDDGIHHKRKQIRVNSTNFSINMPNEGLCFVQKRANIDFDYKSISGICTHFKNANDETITENVSANNKLQDNEFNFRAGSTKDRVYFKNSAFKTTTDWANFFNENEVMLEYECEEYVEAYTEEQQEAYDKIKELHSYQEVTHITCEDEIKTTQEVIYSIEPNIEVENEGNIASRPILKLTKTLDDCIDITINQVRFKYNFLENEDYVEIDCENKEVKYNNLNRNRQIEIGYEFPKLNAGNNEIVLNSGDCIVETKRKDRWL